MAFPPNMQTPGQKAAGVKPPSNSGPSISVSEALDALEAHCSTPQEHAALKTLRSSLEDGPGANTRPSSQSNSPGMQAAKQHMPSFAK